MASPDPVRTLIEETRELARKERMSAPTRAWRYNALADALEASEARGARLSEGIKAFAEQLVGENPYAYSRRHVQSSYRRTDGVALCAGCLRPYPCEHAYWSAGLLALLASCDKDTQDAH